MGGASLAKHRRDIVLHAWTWAERYSLYPKSRSGVGNLFVQRMVLFEFVYIL